MGFLLMQYEYQRASREYNRCHSAGIRLNNQVARYTKRVERMQSVFEKAKSRLQNDFNQIQSQASSALAYASTMQSADAFNNALMGIVIGNMPLGAYVQYNGNATGTDLVSALSAAAAQARTVMTSLIQAVQEVETEKLEEQQNEQLEPIAEKNSDLEAEQALNDTLTEMWKERRDKSKQQLSEDIKNSMAGYGLKG